MKILCQLFFCMVAISLPIFLSASETLPAKVELELECASKDFECLNFLPTAIIQLIANYWEDQNSFNHIIAAFTKLCQNKSISLIFNFEQICFLKKLMYYYTYHADYKNVKFEPSSRAQHIFTSLSEDLRKCLITQFSNKPHHITDRFLEQLPSHQCNLNTGWCSNHLATLTNSTSYKYHEDFPRPCAVNNLGNIIMLRKGLVQGFFSCLMTNGTEVPLIRHLKDFEEIPTYHDGIATWITHDNKLAAIISIYQSKDIPTTIFNFNNPTLEKPDPYLYTCDIVDVEQQGKPIKHGISSVSEKNHANFLKTILQPPCDNLPLCAFYYSKPPSLHIETARTHRNDISQLVIQFAHKSKKNIAYYKIYTYPPDIVTPAQENMWYHLSYPTTGDRHEVMLDHHGTFRHSSYSGHEIRTDPNIIQRYLRSSPILWNYQHTYVLIPTEEPTYPHVVTWELLDIRPEEKKRQKILQRDQT